MVAELGGAHGEAAVRSSRGGHVGVRVGGEGRLELVWVVAIARLMVGMDGGGGEQPVWVWSRVPGMVRVAADTHGELMDYGASLCVGETVAVLQQRGGRGARGQDGTGVVSCGDGAAGRVG